MGLKNFGVPEAEVAYLKDVMKLDVFVEGGTFRGGTAKAMSGEFNNVYTIEKSDEMFEVAKENLKDIENVTMLKGDTRESLPHILEENDDLLFWLDAHWSGGVTYGKEDECPLLEELKIIFSSNKNYVILIDDARLFAAPPPSPHDLLKWPSLSDIIKAIPNDWGLIEYQDVFYLFPKKIEYGFKMFLQKNITKEWIDSQKKSKWSLVKKILKRKVS